MNKTECIKKLLSMIDKLITDEWSVYEFRRNYYDFYIDDIPEDVLGDAELDYFGAIQEKLDFVDENPDSESRAVGWINDAEFISWVKSKPVPAQLKTNHPV